MKTLTLSAVILISAYGSLYAAEHPSDTCGQEIFLLAPEEDQPRSSMVSGGALEGSFNPIDSDVSCGNDDGGDHPSPSPEGSSGADFDFGALRDSVLAGAAAARSEISEATSEIVDDASRRILPVISEAIKDGNMTSKDVMAVGGAVAGGLMGAMEDANRRIQERLGR